MAFRLDFDSSKLNQKMNTLGPKMGVALLMYMNTKATQIEATMKANRKWTDRTGMAKAMLSAKVSQPDDNTIRLTLAQGVEYGIWLELANEKKYAIISPTLKSEAPKIIKGLNKIMSKVKL